MTYDVGERGHLSFIQMPKLSENVQFGSVADIYIFKKINEYSSIAVYLHKIHINIYVLLYLSIICI